MKNKKNILFLLKLLVLAVLLFGLVKTYLYFNSKETVLITCDFEKYSQKDNTTTFLTSNKLHKINIAGKNCEEYSRSGKSSLKVNKQEFINLIELNNIGPDEVYKATVYRKSGSAGIVMQEITTEKEEIEVYIFQNLSCETDENGWEKIVIQLKTPPDYTKDKLKLYIWNPQKEVSYFDDLKIEQLEFMEYPNYDTINSFNIFIEDLEFNKLKKIRERAFKKGVLITADDSYVNTILSFKDKIMQGEVRFKGDWLDHLQGDKWSFRVKLSNNSWRNICTFSLHTPASRSFIDEWFIHKVFLDNDILATRYEFIPLVVNGNSLGIYAYEEHFQKQLLESKLRREAPIISFNESVIWNRRSIQLYTNEDFIFASSVIEPFQEGRTIKNANLFEKFIIAQNLLGSFRSGELTASEVFDIKQTAKYFALQTTFGGYHGAIWHNIRFYYNPITCLLEPIAFDCFSNYGIYTWGFTDIICNFSVDKSQTLPDYSPFYMDLITDKEFINEYISLLKQYSKPSFIQSYLDKYKDQIKIYENQIKHEFLNYQFDGNSFIEHSKSLELPLHAFYSNMSRQSYIDSIKTKSSATRNKKNTYNNKAFFNDFVTFYKNSESEIYVSVKHSHDIKILGFGNDNTIKQSASIKINNLEKTNSYSQKFTFSSSNNENHKYVFFSTPIYDTIYKSRLVQWPAPTTYSPRNDIAANSTDISKYTNYEKQEVHFKGHIVFDNHVYTPIGYDVYFEPGTTIDLKNKSAMIINSNVNMNGTKENPIKIFSSDKTANGFTVLQAEEKSIVNNVVFDNLNTLDYNGWTLTGAVTFYESDVEFYNCIFTNNHCEDMLNTIRCDFLVKDCLLQNTFGDSHDSDFCTGTLNNCRFLYNGNDAIDFSTSDVIIKNCTIKHSLDKAISVGENTKATIKNVIIENAGIGIASKDLSHANIDSCQISNATYGFVLLQKKPEFGPASITATNCELNNIWKEHIIEVKSVLTLNGKHIKGKQQKLKALFYE